MPPVDFDDELSRTVTDLNRRGNGTSAADPGLPNRPVPLSDFMSLGEQTAAALLQAADEHVTQFQNLVEETRALAARIRADVQAKDAEWASMNRRLKEFGTTLVDAHKRFHDGGEAGTS